jgi:hypothetical protein
MKLYSPAPNSFVFIEADKYKIAYNLPALVIVTVIILCQSGIAVTISNPG